jgi:hypothetical protein
VGDREGVFDGLEVVGVWDGEKVSPGFAGLVGESVGFIVARHCETGPPTPVNLLMHWGIGEAKDQAQLPDLSALHLPTHGKSQNDPHWHPFVLVDKVLVMKFVKVIMVKGKRTAGLAGTFLGHPPPATHFMMMLYWHLHLRMSLPQAAFFSFDDGRHRSGLMGGNKSPRTFPQGSSRASSCSSSAAFASLARSRTAIVKTTKIKQ